MFHYWKDNGLVYLKMLFHCVKNINVYVEINYFKESRFNGNETGQKIQKLVLKARLEKNILYSYQFKYFREYFPNNL